MEQVFTDRRGNKILKPEGKEVFNRVSAYGIAKLGNKIFLVNPTWKEEFELPGGGIENEDLIEGLKREFLEETGYLIDTVNNSPISVKSNLFYADDIDTFYISKLFFFSVKIVGKQEPTLINKKEINQSGWYELNNLKINKIHLEVIKTSEAAK